MIEQILQAIGIEPFCINVGDGELIELNAPTKRNFDKIQKLVSYADAVDVIEMFLILINDNKQGIEFKPESVPQLFTAEEVRDTVKTFFEWICKVLEQFKTPYYPNSDIIQRYSTYTTDYAIIHEYTGFNFNEIDNLNIILFRLYIRDSVIRECMKSETGREYLDNCWGLEQTKPDRQSIREHFTKG